MHHNFPIRSQFTKLILTFENCKQCYATFIEHIFTFNFNSNKSPRPHVRVLVVWGEHVSCCLAEAVNEVASSGVWIRSLLPPLCDPSLACAGPPLQLSFILLILSGVMKMDQMKTQETPTLPPTCPGRLTATGSSEERRLPRDAKRAWTHSRREEKLYTDGPN